MNSDISALVVTSQLLRTRSFAMLTGRYCGCCKHRARGEKKRSNQASSRKTRLILMELRQSECRVLARQLVRHAESAVRAASAVKQRPTTPSCAYHTIVFSRKNKARNTHRRIIITHGPLFVLPRTVCLSVMQTLSSADASCASPASSLDLHNMQDSI